MHTYKTTIRFNHCDPAGILFFGNIFPICHNAYEEMIKSFGLDVNYWNNGSFVVPIISAKAEYIKPLRYDDNIEIHVSLLSKRKSSFSLGYRVIKDNEQMAFAETVHVFVSKSTFEKIDIPIAINNKLLELT